jgi:hypothetical protein
MEDKKNPLKNLDYLEYYKFVTDAVAKHGISGRDDLSKLISAEDVKKICLRSYIEKCTPNQAAVMIQLFWDRKYD